MHQRVGSGCERTEVDLLDKRWISESDWRELSPTGSAELSLEDEDAMVDCVASRLNQLGRTATLGLALEIGELVYNAFFKDGVFDRHHPSFRKLAAHPAVPYGVGTIWRAVAIYNLSIRVPHLLQLGNLGVSHYRAVLTLPQADQEKLLNAASSECWTKAQLESAVHRLREGLPRAGRKPMSAVRRTIGQLEKVRTCLEALSAGQEGTSLSPLVESVHRLRTVCDAVLARCAALAPVQMHPERNSDGEE